MTVLRRLMTKVEEQPNGCWIFTGHKNGRGYGVIWDRGAASAHRVAWRELVGPIPDGLVIDHLCRNRACINPDHMELVTNEENVRRGMRGEMSQQSWAAHCKRGHEMAGDNVGWINPKNGATPWRYCRECQRARMRAFRSRKKETS